MNRMMVVAGLLAMTATVARAEEVADSDAVMMKIILMEKRAVRTGTAAEEAVSQWLNENIENALGELDRIDKKLLEPQTVTKTELMIRQRLVLEQELSKKSGSIHAGKQSCDHN